MMGPYRNHPVQLAKSALIALVMSAILVISTEMLEFGVLGLVIFFFSFRIWYKTTYYFEDESIQVNRATAFKADTNIPYSKISSINLTRSVIDRLIGTVTVCFNINSGVNAETPEVSLAMKADKAEELRAFVELKIHGNIRPQEEEEIRDYVTFSDLEVIVHSFLSMPTGAVISSTLFFIYSVFALFSDKAGPSGLFALVVFGFTLVYPMFRQLLRYFDFKAYRSGDTIFLEHGLLQKYHTSFDISRINAVRVQRPFFGRMLRRSYIQAEVVGINAMAKDSTPTLCLMTSDRHNRAIMEQLLPEFIMDMDLTLQPKAAAKPLFLKASVWVAVSVAIAAALCTVMMLNRTDLIDELGGTAFYCIMALIIGFASLYVIISLYGCIVSLRSVGYSFGEDKMRFVYGVVDRTVTIMEYDRVQIVTEVSGPLSRRFGLSTCKVSFLSSKGSVGGAQSGYMPSEDARVVSDTMMARIRDGRYDYRKNEI